MKKATFILVIALGIVATPLAAEAQQAGKMPRIGILCAITCIALPGSPQLPFPPGRVFEARLHEVGYAAGKTLTIDYRGAGVPSDRISAAATELVRRKTDVIVAEGWVAVQAAKAATTAIPIVMVAASDPVELGLVTSLARPGGNLTGLAIPFAELAVKQLELIRETAPGVARVALFANPTSAADRLAAERISEAARAVGVELRVFDVPLRAYNALQRALSTTSREAFGAQIVFVGFARAEVAQAALRARVPTIAPFEEFTAAGGLMAYEPSRSELSRRAADYVAKILKGARPEDLPVEQPMRYDLTVNLQTAKAISLTIPPSVLLRANQVIE